ncbi:uncharacterized protein HMPREF1541_05545 [Cyphellophora europaea CBS 101466]|uniref:Smr domain-containing protein n=1 Tax=Cyphellophora europaea (strain CBS 101466) TaxID=1220924 RepID=W2RS91_CYPE1|nr:uncharacterized protein HMPREF1541_05545 [Cyphellophora europaea CBS 101466]ETN39322.1 hypothetical protein HMPREF1541_05545 [Cyphellophora europaea CBS 101466]
MSYHSSRYILLTVFQALRKTYCPPLDDSLFYAVASDYDLTISEHYAALRATLDALKEDAIVNEAANADPAVDTATDPSISAQNASTTTPDGHSRDITSVISDLSTLNLGANEGSLGEDLEHLSGTEKRKYLKDLFPGTDTAKITDILTEAGSLQGAIDELLNVAFLSTHGDGFSNDGQPQAKGVEGFAEEHKTNRGRKRRNKRKHRTTDSSRANSANSWGTDNAPTVNVWANASGDVDFICSRTTLSAQVVTSLYHRKSANLNDTIKELADMEQTKLVSFDAADPVVQMQVAELKENFPAVSASRIQGLLHLARNIPSATYELLEAMVEHSAEDQPTGKLHGVVQYAAVDLSKEKDDSWNTVTSGSANRTNYGADHSYAASRAFGQAAAAARKSKSDRLMGGAAAYYASIGHEHIKMAKAQSSAAADVLVSQQSTRTMIDLHGVSVSDAVRIANARTQAWWDGLGDARYVTSERVRASFQIVTGVGTHSRNNAPRIGPAVAKSLVREGWRVEVGHGEMFVRGKARR